MEKTVKFKVVKYFKGKLYNLIGIYTDEKKANDMCNYMNEKIKDISNVINFKVERI